MVTTRYSDQQGSKSRQNVMRLYKRWHRPITKRFIKPPFISYREQPRSTRMTGPDCAVMCNLINTYTHTHTHTHEPAKHENFCISARRTSRLVWFVVAAACCLGFLSTHTRKITKLFSLTHSSAKRSTLK